MVGMEAMDQESRGDVEDNANNDVWEESESCLESR